MTIRLPLLPLRDIVVFPLTTMPLLVGRRQSLRACEDALGDDHRILLVAQRDPSVEHPAIVDLYGIGVIAMIVQHLPSSDGRMKLLVRGERRARMVSALDEPDRLAALAEPMEDLSSTQDSGPPLDFPLAAWMAEGPSGAGAKSGDRVADLQRILEDPRLSATERVRAAAAIGA